MAASPLIFDAYDPQKAWISGPQLGIVGEIVVFTGMASFMIMIRQALFLQSSGPLSFIQQNKKERKYKRRANLKANATWM